MLLVPVASFYLKLLFFSFWSFFCRIFHGRCDIKHKISWDFPCRHIFIYFCEIFMIFFGRGGRGLWEKVTKIPATSSGFAQRFTTARPTGALLSKLLIHASPLWVWAPLTPAASLRGSGMWRRNGELCRPPTHRSDTHQAAQEWQRAKTEPGLSGNYQYLFNPWSTQNQGGWRLLPLFGIFVRVGGWYEGHMADFNCVPW